MKQDREENLKNREDVFRIVVCVKQVPAGSQAKIDPVTKTLVRSAGSSILNPYDTFAVETALQMAEQARERGVAASVTALSMGVPSVETLLRDLHARGVDGGVLMTDRAFAGADTFDTSYTLSLGVKEIEKTEGPVSLIICGHMAVDGDTAQIGPELAQTLHLPHVANASRVYPPDMEHRTLDADCLTAEGRQTFRMQLPALITVSKDINVPRLPSIAGIRRAASFTIRILTAESLGVDPNLVGKNGAPTRVVRTFTPELSDGAQRITGNMAESAKEIRNIIGRAI